MGRNKDSSWKSLAAVAATQHGCFTLAQAIAAGFSSQLLNKHLHSKNIVRCHRGVYRLDRRSRRAQPFNPSRTGLSDLMAAYLWSKSLGVFSHASSLYLQGLCDSMPTKIHLTMGLDQAERSLIVPPRIRLYFSDSIEFEWIEGLPTSKPLRTLFDVARARGDSRMLDVARRRVLQRQLASFSDLDPIVAYLGLSGGGRQGEDTSNWTGTHIVSVLTGTCTTSPAVDWETMAEDLADKYGARVLRASFYPGSKEMLVAFAWPMGAGVVDLRAEAAEKFRW